jgi:membrane-associated protease RseP (regulator of RpoE activity)
MEPENPASPFTLEPSGAPGRIPFAAVYYPTYTPKKQRPVVAGLLALLTVISTLVVGERFSWAYARNETPFTGDFDLFGPWVAALHHPSVTLGGLPFSATLLLILLAHELGHFFACKYYRIDASYPYFIPAPTIIGTMGAFIRIRSPIPSRKALFDVGLAGPVVGFAFALPALAIAVLSSKVVPGAQAEAAIRFGDPLLMKLLLAVLRPGVAPGDLLLNPMGRAAWVGLFATALNLLPAGQLDGGHIIYSIAPEKHRKFSIFMALALVPLAHWWVGWLLWAVLLLAIGFRHPPLMDRWEPLGERRIVWAVVALVIFALCFMPTPFASQPPMNLF